MLIWGIFYFLWDDPLFCELPFGVQDDELKDPEFIGLRRTIRLLALQNLYLEIRRLNQILARAYEARKEADAREVWTINQFLKHVPAEIADQILIDRKVNEMDADFSFLKTLVLP